MAILKYLNQSYQCDTVQFKCITKNCPIPSFKLKNVDGSFYTAGKVSRNMGNKKVKLPYSITFSSNGDGGLLGSGTVDVHYNDGKDILRSCSFAIPYFSIVKKSNGLYNVSYNLPTHITSKVYIQNRQESSEIDTNASSYIDFQAGIGADLHTSNASVGARQGYALGGSKRVRQNNKDARQFQEIACPSQSDRSDEVSLNLEYQAVPTKDCDLDSVIPMEFPYDTM